MPATYRPFRWMVGMFQEILDSTSGNSARIKSMTDLRVLSFVRSTEAKYSSTELNLGDFSFLLLFFFFISFLSNFRNESSKGHGLSTSKIPKRQLQEDSSLEGNTTRAIDFHEGDKIDEITQL